MLHVVSHSPFTHTTLNSCLKSIKADDQLLLIQDAVIACATTLWSDLLFGIEVYVLQDDLIARGLVNQSGLVVDMEGYVNLVAQYNSPLCW